MLVASTPAHGAHGGASEVARAIPRRRAGKKRRNRRARAEFFAKLGDALREKRDYDEAIASYQRALRLDPKNFAAISGRERSRALRSLDLD